MKIFIDANILLDIFNNERPFYGYSLAFYEYALKRQYPLFTSCDLITTIYYINSKKDKSQALLNIQDTNKTLKVIEFSNKEIEETCNLMLEDSKYLELNSDTLVSKEKVGYKDLEDTIQYIMAKKQQCDLIISNDKNFVSKDIKILSSEEFCKLHNIKSK